MDWIVERSEVITSLGVEELAKGVDINRFVVSGESLDILFDEIENNRNIRDFAKSVLFVRNMIAICAAHFENHGQSKVKRSEESDVYEKALVSDKIRSIPLGGWGVVRD